MNSFLHRRYCWFQYLAWSYGGSGKLKRPLMDCHCRFRKMNNPSATCTYVTLEEMRKAKRQQMNARTEKDRKAAYHKFSKRDIRNALTENDHPLSDLVH